MPASSLSELRDPEAAIFAAVRRLSRRDGQGDAVIERAAIVAEGKMSVAIEAWVISKGGQPDTVNVHREGGGLHRFGRDTSSRAPRRYVLPAAVLGWSS